MPPIFAPDAGHRRSCPYRDHNHVLCWAGALLAVNRHLGQQQKLTSNHDEPTVNFFPISTPM